MANNNLSYWLFTVFVICLHVNVSVAKAEDEKLGYVVNSLDAEVASNLENTKSLLQQIFANYDKRIRPLQNQSQAIVIEANFTPNAIVNFDTTGQKMDILGFFRVSWKDEDVAWNASEYGGATTVMVPLTEVWYPRLVIYRAYDGQGVVGDRLNDMVRLRYNGIVDWVPNGIYGSLCDVDATFYPYDEHTCFLEFYVTDQPISKVQLHTAAEVSLNTCSENSEWRLKEVTSSVRLNYGVNIVSVSFRIARRASFTVYTMIIPLLTLSILSVITFIVPVQSGEKGGLSITIFLSYGFFIAITRDTLPHNAVNIPCFVTFICGLLVLSVFTVVYVMIESKIYYTYGNKTFDFPCIDISKWLPKKSKIAHDRQTPILNKKENTNKTRYNPKQQKETRVRFHEEVGAGTAKTWAEVLQTLDIILMCVSAAFLCIFSAVVWSSLINQ